MLKKSGRLAILFLLPSILSPAKGCGLFDVCKWQQWGWWGSCSATCGGGTMKRVRSLCCGLWIQQWSGTWCGLISCGISPRDYTDTSVCSRVCYYGGTYDKRNKACLCREGFEGECCEEADTCLGSGEMFESRYTSASTPLKAYTSSDVTVTSRIKVQCNDTDYSWSINRLHDIDGEFVVAETLQRMAFNDNTLKIGKGTVSAGLISVTLYMYAHKTNAFINGSMYIDLQNPPPVAFILGGSKRSVRYVDGNITINAIDGSFDLGNGGDGNRSGLVFQWECYIANGTTFEDIEKQAMNDTYGWVHHSNCSLENISPGIVLLDLTKGSDTQGYIINVTVRDKMALEASYTQILKAVPGNPPDVMIVCTINCQDKVAMSSPVNMRADCFGCSKAVDYEWSLSLFDDVNDTYPPVIDFASKCLTGLHEPAMVIRAGSLVPGRKYSLTLKAWYVGESPQTTQITDLFINYPPYNGSCSNSEDPVYIVPLERLSITCDHWLDEEGFSSRDLHRDQSNAASLTYLYETRTRRYDAQGREETVSIILYQGDTSFVKNIALQMGDARFNYTVELRVLVLDKYGDREVASSNITVKPHEAVEGIPSDTGAISDMFSQFDLLMNKTQSRGDPMSVVGLCGSMASVLKKPKLNASSLSSANSSEETVANMFISKITDLSRTVKKFVLNEETLVSLRASDAQKVAMNLEAIVGNPMYITDQVALDSSEVLAAVMDKIRNISHKDPFPMQDIIGIEGATAGSMSCLDKILSSLIPEDIVDIQEKFSVESLHSQLRNEEHLNLPWRSTTHATVNISASNMTFTTVDYDEAFDKYLWQKAQELYDKKKRKIEVMRQKSRSANDTLPYLMASLDNIYEVKLGMTEVGAGRSEIIRDFVKIGVEKLTIGSMNERNGSITTLDGVKLGFQYNETGYSSNAVNVKYAVFKRPPFIDGQGIASLTSTAVEIDVNDVSLEPEASIPNAGAVQQLSINLELTGVNTQGMFYVSYDLPYDEDVTILYINPDDMDASGDVGVFYDVYIQAEKLPTTTNYKYSQQLSVSDWEADYGMKTLLPPMRKGKKYIGFKQNRVFATKSNARRRRRSLKQQNITETDGLQVRLIIFTTGCRLWDGVQSEWVSNACKVLPMTTINDTVCRCPRVPGGSLFATTFYVPPNAIEFSTVFSKFDASNASVYGVCIALILVWIIAVFFLRKEDKKDRERWATYFLRDSEASDAYFYMVTVETGMRQRAGTRSTVYFLLVGEDSDTGMRILEDGNRKGFPTGSVRTFFMGTKEALGHLSFMKIWHNSEGQLSGGSWFLNRIIVDDLHKNERFVFQCDQWLGAEKENVQTDIGLPLTASDKLSGFTTLFYQHTWSNVTESHLWLSLVLRPRRSSFTRVQRVSCILTLLYLTMISNAMFFQSSNDDSPTDFVTLGGLKLSLSILFISLTGVIIATPPIIIASAIFKRCKTKSARKSNKLLQYLESTTKGHTTHSLEEGKTESTDTDDFFRNDHLPWPYWTAYVAWIILSISVIVSAFFLILYSMDWGKSKSEEWMSSFMLSFFESLFLVDPSKVVILALVFSLLFKQPVETSGPNVDLEKLREASKTVHGFGTRKTCDDLSRKNLWYSDRGSSKQSIPMRKNNRSSRLWTELIAFGIVVFCVYGISYIDRDPRSYALKNYIENELLQQKFKKVNRAEDWHKWMKDTFLPAYFPTTHINGAKLGARERLFFGDITSVRLGPARLRQVRMTIGDCKFNRLTWPEYPCVNPYNEFEEDTTNYCVHWKTYRGSICENATYRLQDNNLPAWSFTDASDIWGVSVAGEYGVYGGGGYILHLSDNSVTSKTQLHRLLANNWIDRGTRAVFLEFTLYSPNVNLLVSVIFLTEFPEIGGAFSWTHIQTLRPVISLERMSVISLVCYGVYTFYLIFETGKLLFKMKRRGFRACVRQAWNLADIVCVILGYLLIVMFAFRVSYANMAMQKYYKEQEKTHDEKDFINFQHIVIWDAVLNNVLAVLVFIITLRVLRMLGYNRKLAEFIRVISRASSELLSFVVVFGIIFAAYIALGFLLFGKVLKEYRSLLAAWGTLTSTFIGRSFFRRMMEIAPEMAQLYYFSFVFTVLMIIATMFAAILNSSISEVKNDSKRRKHDYGLFSHLFRFLQNFFKGP